MVMLCAVGITSCVTIEKSAGLMVETVEGGHTREAPVSETATARFFAGICIGEGTSNIMMIRRMNFAGFRRWLA